MAQIKNGKVIGTVKTEIFGEVNLHVRQGVQQMRSASSDTPNPQSAGQMYQRLKMLNCAPVYQALKEAIALGWENVPQGQSLYNRFTGMAMRTAPFGITKELHAKGAGIAWGAQITSGTLPVIAVDDNRVTNIRVNGMNTVLPSTTVGQLADAIVSGNPGIFAYDDEIAFIELLQSVDAEGTPKLSCTRAAIILEQGNNTPISDLVSLKGFGVRNGYLAMSGTPAIGAYCWVHSRMTESGLKVSKQTLITNNEFILSQFGAPAALRKAAKSMGANLFSEEFLKPTTSLSRKALRAFAIDVNVTKGAKGSLASQILGVEYADVAYFAGEEAPEMDLSASNKVKIILADAGQFAQEDLEVSVNGKGCTGLSMDGNSVTVTLPEALDGDYLRLINLTDGATFASFRMK